MTNPEPVHVLSALENDKPKFSTTTDAIAIVLHYVMVLEGFHLEGVSASDSTKPPEKWNQSSEIYSFRYKHSRSSMTFSLKCLVLEDKLLVHAVAIENTKNIFDLELSIDDYVNKNVDLNDYDKLYKNFDKLVTLCKVNISRKLVPEINKPGYEANTTANTNNNNNNNRRNDNPDSDYDPLRIGPIRQPPPSNYNPLRGDPSIYGPPFVVGTGDRFPAITPPLPGMGGFGGNTGNWIGPNHPGFGINDPFAPDTAFGQPFPRGAIPPGARFDPFGPPAPSTGPFRNGGRGSQGRGSGPGFGPNPDHERVPSEYDDMFS